MAISVSGDPARIRSDHGLLDADDIADVVVAALTDDRHVGQLYELTGPRLLTLAEAASELSTAVGREVHYLPVTPEEYASELVTHGMPEEEAVPIAEVLDGRNSCLTDGVQRALGRSPRDFADYARDTAATGVLEPGGKRLMSPFAETMTIICAVGAGTAAGAFFTFSTFTMEGLKRLAPAQGAAAMQAINREAPSPLFMLLLFGTGAACLVLMSFAALHLRDASSKYQLIAGALYVVGVVLVTVGYHVPRNNMLDSLDPNSAEGVAYWATYLKEWVRMNHVRTIAPLVAAVLLTVSLRVE